MTKCAGLLGYPVSHSSSPRLHGFWIQKYGLDASYEAHEVQPDELMSQIADLKSHIEQTGNEFRGCNLTLPLKETIIPYIDQLEQAASEIGAVNTLVISENGELQGKNTDWIGFRDSLGDHLNLDRFVNGTALVLGAGGAARAILYALKSMGFSKIFLTNRTQARAQHLANEMKNIPIEVVPWDEKEQMLSKTDLLVNTTSLGMKGQPPLILDLTDLKKTAVVTDIVYAPLETELLKQARLKGHSVVDGLGMLLHQAKAGFEAWFGVYPEVDKDLRHHVLEGLK
ncbi:shikimate dehydrogenase [Sneathiella limimaris]|uniref:shikimate dehydrogenase n=1 Tax=Sneathiella limimaris TaxID=1964213 RepID=UPI00146DDF8C|nr:shikimate dehydrogenase [Sneathiella limimaris]